MVAFGVGSQKPGERTVDSSLVVIFRVRRDAGGFTVEFSIGVDVTRCWERAGVQVSRQREGSEGVVLGAFDLPTSPVIAETGMMGTCDD